MIINLYSTFVVIYYVLLSTHQTDAINPDRELVYNGTIFAIFSASTDEFDQVAARDNCISWGGNIASINSQEEDAQLFSLTNAIHFQCWIGLNKHPNSILKMVNRDEYVWEDGSNGTYRKFIPDASSLRYVKFRPNNYSLSEEWKDVYGDDDTNCYLCRKTANSRGCDFTNNGSCYRTYQVDPAVNWTDAQSSCEEWGGNLASVTSEAENLLLFTRTPIKAFSCWAGKYTDVNGNITWNDGNAFSYQKWFNGKTSTPNCINWNFRGNNAWVNADCNTVKLKCYICKRIITTVSNPEVKDETLYSDSVFGYFYASWPGVTWNTALQECIGWGGSLASIESAAEDGTLYNLTAGNDTQCWIGLEISTRSSESIIWVDGSDSSYRNYPGQTSTISSIDKYYSLRSMNGSSDGGWNALNMAETLSCFYCEKLGKIFGELINDNLGFREIPNNTILYRNATLLCGDTNTTRTILWSYSSNTNAENEETLPATGVNTTSGLSWIEVSTTKQGFYQCRIDKNAETVSVYTVGIFNDSTTTVAIDGRIYYYTIGIDRENILLLCDPMNNNINPITSTIWKEENTIIYNPYMVNSSQKSTRNLTCEVSDTPILTIMLITQVPVFTINYQPPFKETYEEIYPTTNQLSIQGLKQNFVLSSNIEGRWKLPDGNYHTGSNITYPYFFQQHTGMYTFYLYNWDGIETPVFELNINGVNNIGIFLEISETNEWEFLQNNSRLFLREHVATLMCVGTDNVSRIEWLNQGMTVDYGISNIGVGMNQTPGYYHCSVDEVAIYSIYIASTDLIDNITDFSQPISSVLGSSLLLYHFDASVTDSQIRWTTERVDPEVVKKYDPEFENPVPLSTVFSDVGGGRHDLTCFYRNSPATVLGVIDLSLKDTANMTVSYLGYEKSFSDANNPSFPTPQSIEIPSNISTLTLRCSLPQCIWEIKNTNDVIRTDPSFDYTITTFQKEDEGTYSILRTTDSGKEYITASVSISISAEQVKNSSLETYIVYIGIAVPIILCFSLFIIIIVVIIIVCISKKRRKPKQFASRQFTNEDSDSPSKANDVQNSNGLCSTVKSKKKKNYEKFDEEIVETTFTQSIESANYQNITVLKQDDDNTYEKVPENIRSLSIPLDTYKMHVNELWQNEGSLENDYETLGGKAHRYPCTNGTLDPNRVKNRFKLIYPYDKSRVILKETSEDPSSDYINASYIPGLYVRETFIAAQAPKDVTLQSFWQMIVENDVSNIVMVTNLVESGRIKCEAYFPVKEGKKLITGQYEIILDKEEILIGYTIRMLTVFHNGKNKQIKQFHFTAWPDHDVPDLHNELLLFVEKVQTQKIDSKSPILVHCSAGVGRSGTFLAIYNLLAAIKQGNAISIYNVVHEMREHRPQMVQTFSQYKFIYLSVLEMLLGSTSIPNDEFTATYKLYMQSESEGYVSVFFQQFSELNYQCDKGFEHICTTALNDSNKDKNPIKTILPSDKNRAILFSPHWEGDYINATGIDDNRYIITITPTRNTLEDFLQLLYQFKPSMVVFLATPKELRLIQDEKSDRVVYWPKQGEPLDTNAFTLTSLSSEKFSSMIRSKIRLTHTIENDVSEFTHITSTKWNERGEPDLVNVVMLLHALIKQKQDNPGSPIIFHCTDGVGKTGVLFTVFKAILESKEKNFIDIFHIVKKLRNERMNFVSTLNHFVSCFSLMNEYCSNAV